MSRALGNLLSSLYTLALFVLVLVAVRRWRAGDESPAVLWLALLSLGALRSPFAPRYVVVSSLWLLALLACEAARRPARIALLVAVWLLLAIEPPLPWPRGRMLVSLVYQ